MFRFASLAAVLAGLRAACLLFCLNRSLAGVGAWAATAEGVTALGGNLLAELPLLSLLVLLGFAALAVAATRSMSSMFSSMSLYPACCA